MTAAGPASALSGAGLLFHPAGTRGAGDAAGQDYMFVKP